MTLHGLGHAVVGVPDVGASGAFYRDFGLIEDEPGTFSTVDGGRQLYLVERPVRRLVELAIAADDADDLGRVRRAAEEQEVRTADDDSDVLVTEPVLGFHVRVTVRPRIEQVPVEATVPNRPGRTERGSARSPAIFAPDAVRPAGSVTFSMRRPTSRRRAVSSARYSASSGATACPG